MEKKDVYEIIQMFLEKREEQNIPLTKEGLLLREKDKDYIIKVTKKKV